MEDIDPDLDRVIELTEEELGKELDLHVEGNKFVFQGEETSVEYYPGLYDETFEVHADQFDGKEAMEEFAEKSLAEALSFEIKIRTSEDFEEIVDPKKEVP